MVVSWYWCYFFFFRDLNNFSSLPFFKTNNTCVHRSSLGYNVFLVGMPIVVIIYNSVVPSIYWHCCLKLIVERGIAVKILLLNISRICFKKHIYLNDP